jgi:superfamily I DNA/RNA helicase
MAYTFSLPSVTVLSDSQKAALYAEAEDVFIISGCPGSGKTTVALLRSRGKKFDSKYHYTVWANLLFGYLLNLSPQLDVGESYFSTFHSWFWGRYRKSSWSRSEPFDEAGISESFDEDNSNHGEYYEEFQLDEGQDLPLVVRAGLSKISNKLVICMDEAQDVMGMSTDLGNEVTNTMELCREYGKSPISIKLTTNWRNTKPIFLLSKAIVPEINSTIKCDNYAKEKGILPILYKLPGNDIIFEKIVEIIKGESGRNIGIMHDSLNVLNELNGFLKEAGVETTIYNGNEHRRRSYQEKRTFLKSMSNVVLCTFKSCKGLEFNTVIVPEISHLSDDLTSKKGYYVGCTRAQDRLVLFQNTNSYNLPNWFQGISSDLYEVISNNQESDLF